MQTSYMKSHPEKYSTSKDQMMKVNNFMEYKSYEEDWGDAAFFREHDDLKASICAWHFT